MGDPVFDFLDSGGKTAAPAPAAPQKSGSSNDPVYDFLNSGGKGIPDARSEPIQQSVKQKDYSPDNTTTPEVAAHVVTGMGSSIVGGWRGLATLATGGTMEDAANAVRDAQESGTYQPQGVEARKVVGALGSPANPLNWIPMASKKAGEFTQDVGLKLADSISDYAPKTAAAIRSATPAIATGMEVAGNVVGPVAVGKALKLVGGKTVPAEEAVPEQRIEPTLSTDATGEPVVKSVTQAAPPEAVPLKINEPAPAENASPVNARTTSADIGEETPKYLESPPESATPADQQARIDTLRRVGVTQVRKSAIEGDPQSAATDYQVSKIDSPEGRHMKSVLDAEKGALQNYSEGIVRDTGGTLGSDTSTLYSRGNSIVAPFDELNNYFNQRIKALYQEADARAGGQPVELPKTHELVGGDQAEFLGTTEGESLLKGIKARMKSLGMVDDQGAPQSVTIKQAEQLKQYLNNQWQPRTSRLISGLKNAIDDDVMTTAGEDVYKQARAMRAMKADVFENDLTDPQGRTIPNGVAKILDANGKNVELLKDTEKVPDVVTSLPADQLGQIVKSLKHMPPELADKAQAALAEIKAQFTNKIHDVGSAQAGQWAAKNVSKYLNQNSARLQQVFTPDELAKINDLNDAGHILAKDQSYPGAAAQGYNLMQRGALGAVESGSAAVGSAIGGAPGAAVGGLIGKTVAKKMGESMSLKAAQKRTINLSDFPK